MHKTVSFGTAAAIGFALAACGSADRSESQATDANAMTVNEVGTVADPNMTMGTNDTAMTMAPTSAPDYASMAAASDLFEIESATVAQSQAQSAQVKEFAQMLATDHSKSTADLKQIASKENVTLSQPTLTPDMQSKIDALRAAKGEQFDMLFVTQQIPAHEMALKLHQGYAQSGDNATMKDFASKTASVVAKHLDEARAMSKQ